MTKTTRTVPWTCALAMAAALTPALRADIISTFTTSDEGWTSFNTCPFNASGGNPPGDLYCGEQVLGPTIIAPAKFLGNDLAAYGNVLTLDIFNQTGNIAVSPDMVGGGLGEFLPFATPAIGVPPS